MRGRRPQPSSRCHVSDTGEVPWIDRYVRTDSLKEMRSETSSQRRLISAGVICSDRRIPKMILTVYIAKVIQLHIYRFNTKTRLQIFHSVK